MKDKTAVNMNAAEIQSFEIAIAERLKPLATELNEEFSSNFNFENENSVALVSWESVARLASACMMRAYIQGAQDANLRKFCSKE